MFATAANYLDGFFVGKDRNPENVEVITSHNQIGFFLSAAGALMIGKMADFKLG